MINFPTFSGHKCLHRKAERIFCYLCEPILPLALVCKVNNHFNKLFIIMNSRMYQGNLKLKLCCSRLYFHLITKSKGQKKLKWFFQVDISSKNELMNPTLLLWNLSRQVDLFSYVFWRKLKTQKRHFKINWPLKL